MVSRMATKALAWCGLYGWVTSIPSTPLSVRQTSTYNWIVVKPCMSLISPKICNAATRKILSWDGSHMMLRSPLCRNMMRSGQYIILTDSWCNKHLFLMTCHCTRGCWCICRILAFHENMSEDFAVVSTNASLVGDWRLRMPCKEGDMGGSPMGSNEKQLCRSEELYPSPSRSIYAL